MSADNLSTNDAGTPDRFNRIVALLITSALLLATLLTWRQANADAEASRTGREASRLALEAMGLQAVGQARSSHAWQNEYQAWALADDQAALAERVGETAAAERHRAVRDHLANLSSFLNPPFFLEGDPFPDLAAYEVDLFLVEATLLSERYTLAARQNDAWDAKARAYTTQLTFLAVTLSLYGLSTALASRAVRWLFVMAGTGIAGLTVLWLLVVWITPVPTISNQALQAYAEGVGLAYQGGENNLRQSVDRLSRVLGDEPSYAAAYFERGNAHYLLREYELAVADYEAAQRTGKDDVLAAWNLGWNYYLLGRFDEAIQVDLHGLRLDPEAVGLRLNLGLAYLVSGRTDEAMREYRRAMDQAAEQVRLTRERGEQVPSSLWFYLDAGGIDLDNLVDSLDGQIRPWTEAPPAGTIQDPTTVRQLAQDMILSLKSMTAALEYTNVPPESVRGARISPLEFALEVLDDQGNFVEYERMRTFPYGTDSILVLFDYEGMRDGQSVLWKVYYQGSESVPLRLVEEHWTLGESGAAEKPIGFAYTNYFILGPGEYVVEMFVDWTLVQRGRFAVVGPSAAGEARVETESGTVLFQDGFSDPFSGWDRLQADTYSIDYVQGGYHILVDEPNIVAWGLAGLSFSNASLEVTARKFAGPDENNFGVICRYQDADNYYLFQITGDGFYSIFKRVAGLWELLGATEMGFSDAIVPGDSSNRLRADCVGDRLALYANGELLTEVRDADLTDGDVGLLAGTYATPGTWIVFDDFVVREP